MKLYDWKIAANPRRVMIYLAEKGIEVTVEDVGDPDSAQLKAAYKERFPDRLVPVLELDDGTCIGEAMAICRYFETLYPEPPLMGTDARDQAVVEMWERRAENEGLLAVSEAFRNAHPGFAGRGLPGTGEPVPQIPELVDRGRARVRRFYDKIDAQLAANEFLAGERFTVADITAFVTVKFARTVKVEVEGERPNLERWYGQVSARPSANA